MRKNEGFQIRQLLRREVGGLAVDVVGIVLREDVHHRGGTAVEHVWGGAPDFTKRRRVPLLAFVHWILHAKIVLLEVGHQIVQRMAGCAARRDIDVLSAFRGGG